MISFNFLSILFSANEKIGRYFILVTQNLLILTLKEGKEVLLDQSGFTEGDEATVMAVFLRK